jgi:hypothetical protein
MFVYEENYDIAILTESKIKSVNIPHFLQIINESHSVVGCGELDVTKRGIIVIIKNEMYHRCVNIETFNSLAIKIDIVQNTGSVIRLIAVYSPCDDKTIKYQMTDKVKSWCSNRLEYNHIIITGDFNENLNKKHRTTPLYDTCMNFQLVDVHDMFLHTDILDHTWTASDYKSRIDYFLTDEKTFGKLIHFHVEKVDELDTDHLVMTMEIRIGKITSSVKPQVTNIKQVDKENSDENWEEYKTFTDIIGKHIMEQQEYTNGDINEINEMIQSAILTSRDNSLTMKKINYKGNWKPKGLRTLERT